MTSSDKSIADQYQALTDIEHVLHRPSMYIGSCQVMEEHKFIADVESTQITKKKIQHCPGLVRLFEEIILNAYDHTIRSVGCNEIRVDVDQANATISVMNNGDGIPVVVKEQMGCYVSQMLFGNLRSGSNYDDKEVRLIGGQNYLGSKLTVVFSKSFTIETIDSVRNKRYTQTWSNHMETCSSPVITKCSQNPMTRVTFTPDLDYFRVQSLNDDMILLMKKRVIDISYASKSNVKTYFNGTLISLKKSEDYMKLYTHPEREKFIVDETHERWSVGVILSNDGFQHASFVNGIDTSVGGSHVDHVVNQIVKVIIDKLKSKKIDVKTFDVKNKMFVFVKAAVVNPVFDSQSKECMKMAKTKFGSEFIMSDAFKKKLQNSSITKSMLAVSELKKQKDLSKTNGVKTSRLTNIDTLEDATYAGIAKALQARLILTEGLSAKTFAMSALNVIGRDCYGIFPLKGKLLNVRNVAISRVSANEEISNIVKILGLKYEFKYDCDVELPTLRYGGVVVLADSDTDGFHICGLVINYFHMFWPELLKQGYVSFCITPIVKVYKGNDVLPFYTLHSYEKWLASARGTFKTKYFKGLGTSSAKEACEAMQNIEKKLITFESDAACDDHMSLAFNAKRADNRKEWLMQRYNPASYIDRSLRTVPISDFINYELSHFSTYDCARSLPNIMDGLKPPQRKILCVSLKHVSKSEMKVGQLAPKVAELTDYHHGEQSLMGAIIGLAQDYVGTNNINLLEPHGQFGLRIVAGGGDAASPRYIFTKMNPIAMKMFDHRDSSLLKYLQSDGSPIEPK